MIKVNTIYIVVLGLLSLTACEKPKSNELELNPKESFEDSDAPEQFEFEDRSFYGPWGYAKTNNAQRNYPIVVSGKWGEGEKYYQNIAQKFPAFVIDYQKTSVSDGEWLGQWIRRAINAGYRIDSNRIYLTGFSWGGSSSYPLAQGMYKQGICFAAIVRVAGQSKSDLGNEIAKQTAVWYHIGLKDTETRVKVARDALEYMRNYECNKGAVETHVSDSISGYERTTVTLNRLGYPMFKYSEYKNMGHTPGPCYTDTILFAWLFNHSLKLR